MKTEFGKLRLQKLGKLALSLGTGGGVPALPPVIQANAWSQPVYALRTGANCLPRATPNKIPGVDASAAGMAVVNNSGGGLNWKTVTITGAGRAISGWDFSGCLVVVRGSGCTVEDNLFAPPLIWKVSTSEIVVSSYALQIGIGADNVADALVQFNDFDGGLGKCNTAVFLGQEAARAIVGNNRYRYFASDNVKSLCRYTSDADRPVLRDSFHGLGGWGSPTAHYDAITIARGGAHILNNCFEETPQTGAYGLNNSVRLQADVPGYVIDNVLVENLVSYGRTGPSLPFQNSNDNSAVGAVRFRNIIVEPNGTGAVFPTGQQDSEGFVEITGALRFPDGAAIATPALKPGGFTYAPTLASVPSGAGAGIEVGTFGAVDVNGDAISYSLQDSAGGRFAIAAGNKLVTGLVATDYPTATSHALVVRILDAGGKYMDRNLTIAVSEGLPTITVDQASVRFPTVNSLSSAIAGASYSYIAASNPSPTTGTWYNNDQCWLATLEVPWEQLDGLTGTALCGVLGNLGTTAATQARTFGLFIGPRKHATLAGKLQLTANSESGQSADWFKQALDISALRRMLVAFRRDGSNFRFEIYSDGALVTSVTQAVGAFATSARIQAGFPIGTMGSSAGVPLSSGSVIGFPGSIGLTGHYVGAVTQADLEAISAGVHPLTQLTAANWRQYRDLPDVTSGSLAKPAAATGDATAAFTTTGTGFGRGSDLTPRRSGANWFASNYIPDGYVWGLQPGQTTATLTLSGKASGLTGLVEARVFDETGQVTKNWTALTGSTIAGGVWSGTIAAPKNSGWGHIDLRPAADPTLVHRLRGKLGVGYKFGIMGQSQLAIALGATTMAKAPGASAALSYQAFDATTLMATLKRATPLRPLTDFMAVAADLALTYTTAPICLVDMAVAGTGIDELLDDSEADRRWSDITTSLAMCGADVSAVVINWSTNNQSTFAILEGYLDPLIRGDAPAGASPAYTVDHYLRDGLTFPSTMAIVLSPPTRHTDATKASATDFSGGAYTGPAGAARADYYAYPAAHAGVVAAIGPPLNDMAITTGGGPHEPTDIDEGPSRIARRLLVGLLRGIAIDTTADPAITGATLASSTTITVNVSRPNGGTLQTAWALKGVAVPGGESTVQGFEISTNGGTTWSRSGFTAEITDAAGGVVTLTKASGTWVTGVRARYLANGPLDYGLPTEALQLYHGTLYESGALEGGIGLPARGGWSATL